MRSFLRILLAIIFTWSFSDELEFRHFHDSRGKSNSADPKMSLRSTWTLHDVIDLKHQVPQGLRLTSAQNDAGENSIFMPILYAPKSSIIVFMYYNRRQPSDSSIT